MAKIEIDQEIAEITYSQIKMDLAAGIFDYERIENFKKFIQNYYREPKDINGIFTGIHKMKQEYLFAKFASPKGEKEYIEAQYKADILKMYWDCAVLFSNLVKS